jgi:type VI secretion system secreted protein Hcp
VAYQFYARIKGQKSGDIKGSVTQKDRAGQIECFAMSHSVLSKRDPTTGLPTGKRQHQPFTITKGADQSTPLLLNVLFTNENLTECTFIFYRTDGQGAEKEFMTITLTNASISSYDQYTASPDQLNQFDANELEDIEFTYQKIEVAWLNPALSAEDDWESPATK